MSKSEYEKGNSINVIYASFDLVLCILVLYLPNSNVDHFTSHAPVSIKSFKYVIIRLIDEVHFLHSHLRFTIVHGLHEKDVRAILNETRRLRLNAVKIFIYHYNYIYTQ